MRILEQSLLEVVDLVHEAFIVIIIVIIIIIIIIIVVVAIVIVLHIDFFIYVLFVAFVTQVTGARIAEPIATVVNTLHGNQRVYVVSIETVTKVVVEVVEGLQEIVLEEFNVIRLRVQHQSGTRHHRINAAVVVTAVIAPVAVVSSLSLLVNTSSSCSSSCSTSGRRSSFGGFV